MRGEVRKDGSIGKELGHAQPEKSTHYLQVPFEFITMQHPAPRKRNNSEDSAASDDGTHEDSDSSMPTDDGTTIRDLLEPDDAIIYSSSFWNGQVSGAAYQVQTGNDYRFQEQLFKFYNYVSNRSAELFSIREALKYLDDDPVHPPYKNIIILTQQTKVLLRLTRRGNLNELETEIVSLLKSLSAYVIVRPPLEKRPLKALKMKAKKEAKSQAISGTTHHEKFDRFSAQRAIKEYIKREMTKRFDALANPVLKEYLQNWGKIPKFLSTNFIETQFISRHGASGYYLHWMERINSPLCPCDNSTVQTIQHIMLSCSRFDLMREEELIDAVTYQPFTANKLSDFMSSIGRYRAHKALVQRIHPVLLDEHKQREADSTVDTSTIHDTLESSLITLFNQSLSLS